MEIALETQRALYDTHAAAALEALQTLLVERGPELIALGAERAFRTVGVLEYGDSTYRVSASTLEDETFAELADAIFYHHIAIARTAGDLPQPEELRG